MSIFFLDLAEKFKTSRLILDMPEEVKAVLYKMMAKKPENRISIHDIINSQWLNDPFVKVNFFLIYNF